MAGHSACIECVIALSNGRFSCSRDRTLKLWNQATNECINTLKGHNAEVHCPSQ